MFSSAMDTNLTLNSLETVNITSQLVTGKCGLDAKPAHRQVMVLPWVGCEAKQNLN